MPARTFFSGEGFDRADALRDEPAALAELAGRADALELVWNGGIPALGADGRLCWQPVGEATLFLGLDQGAPRFAALPEAAAAARPPFDLLSLLDADAAAVFAAALSLASWHRRHRHCANCGAISAIVRGGWSRRCGSCEAEHFPRVDPVVIMGVEHEDRLLLGRQPFYPPGVYSTLAGFVEVGEALEDAVAREVLEEAGVRVADVRYVTSQPWPFPSSLMIGCMARALDGKLTVDAKELEDARWFSRGEVTAAIAGDCDASFAGPPRYAIARTLMEHWLAA